MDLLDEKQQKQLYDETKDRINTAYLYTERLKDNQNSLLDTIKELLVTGGIDKVKALREQIADKQFLINYAERRVGKLDKVTGSELDEVYWGLQRLLNILDVAIANESLNDAYTLMFWLSTGATDQLIANLGDDNDNDGNDDADPVFN